MSAARFLATLGVLGMLLSLAAPGSALAGKAPEYKTMSEIEDQIAAAAKKHKGDATAFRLTDSAGRLVMTVGVDKQDVKPKKDIKRRFIWALKIAKGGGGAGGAKRVNILMTGTHHAREWVAYRVVLDAAEYILDNKGAEDWPAGDARFDFFRKFKELNIKKLTDNANIFAVPVVNPEGYQYSRRWDPKAHNDEGGWRKSRRDVSKDPEPPKYSEPKKLDSKEGEGLQGVDLNRNYPADDWSRETGRWVIGDDGKAEWIVSTSRSKWRAVYCGRPNGNDWDPPIRPPLVENETRAIIGLATRNKFSCLIDVHSWGGQVGWPLKPAAGQNLRPGGGFEDKEVFWILATVAAEMIKDPVTGKTYKAENPYDLSGDSVKWQYDKNSKRKSLAFLIEVGTMQVHGQRRRGHFRPRSPEKHARAVLPGQLFLIFGTIDKRFASIPKAKFSKPGK